MTDAPDPGHGLVEALAAATSAVVRHLDRSLGSIRGLTFAEYRLLRSLADAPGARASRADLARSVALTPSGVTRALRPLEDLGYVASVRNQRDARLALASLTPAGTELIADATSVVDDVMSGLLDRWELSDERVADLVSSLHGLARA